MCVIILKPRGKKLPDKGLLKICFENNPDGAGFMFQRGKGEAPQWQKGFMSFPDFWRAWSAAEFSKGDLVGVHFRIRTSGDRAPGLCHPFPVAREISEMLKLSGEADFICEHNGIVGGGSDLESDTMIFIREILFGLAPFLKNKGALQSFANLSKGSRFLIFSRDYYYRTGSWIESKSGLLFSNDSYLPRAPAVWDYYSKNNWSYPGAGAGFKFRDYRAGAGLGDLGDDDGFDYGGSGGLDESGPWPGPGPDSVILCPDCGSTFWESERDFFDGVAACPICGVPLSKGGPGSGPGPGPDQVCCPFCYEPNPVPIERADGDVLACCRCGAEFNRAKAGRVRGRDNV